MSTGDRQVRNGPELPTCSGLGTAKGMRASIGTTQGEMVVPKLFPRKGPRGTYSHFWMSRAAGKTQLSPSPLYPHCPCPVLPTSPHTYHSSHS